MSTYRLIVELHIANAASDELLAKLTELDGVTAAEILPLDEADRRRAVPPEFPELVGIAEIADILEISRSRANALQARPGFPAPVARLRSGPVWRLDDLSTFARSGDHAIDGPAGPETPAAPPVDLAKLVGAVNNFIPSPLARNAVKLVRWYATRPKT